MDPKISIITPCYNHGHYLDETVDSVDMNHNSSVFEHIIVNDGSTDQYTLDKLNELEKKGIIIIHQENKGLAAARNEGIRNAKGDYILLLDSDNKIIPSVFVEGLKILESDCSLDVFHTYAIYFGEKRGIWKLGKFNLTKMFFQNHIDACALIRKSTLEKVGWYSIDMPVMGHEDWELWIKIGIANGKFYLLPTPGFYYRVSKESMVNIVSTPQVEKTIAYIFNKHHYAVSKSYQELFEAYEEQRKKFADKIDYIHKHRLKSILKLIIGKTLE